MNKITEKIKQLRIYTLLICALMSIDAGGVFAQVACSCGNTTPIGMVIIQSSGNNPIKVNCQYDSSISTFSAKCNVPYTITDAPFSGCGSSKACQARVEYSITGPGQTGTPQSVLTPFTLTSNGTYTVTVRGMCGNTVCQKCELRLVVDNCSGAANCCPGKWTQLSYTVPGAHPLVFKCEAVINTKCNIPVDIDAMYGSCPIGCDSNVTYSVSGGATISTNGVFTATANGTYTVTINGMCGGKVCNTCTVHINVTGCIEEDKCCPGKWTNLTLLEGYVSNVPIAKLKCGNAYELKCNMPYTVNGDYICSDKKCKGYIAYMLSVNGGPFYANSGTFTPTASGTYTLVMYGICNGDTCEKCPIKFNVKCEDIPANCCPGKWGDRTFGKAGAQPVALKCDKSYIADCNTDYNISAPYICPQGCSRGETTYSVSPAGATVSNSGTFRATANGYYTLRVYGACNGKICDSCIFFIKVSDCPQTSCCPGKWGEKQFGQQGKPSAPFDCGKTVAAKCKIPYQVTASYLCPRPCGPNGTVEYSVSPAGATISGSGLFTATSNGTYTVKLRGLCDGKVCDSCLLYIRVDHCPEEPQDCCRKKLEVNGQGSTLTQQSTGGNAYSLYTANIQLSGGAGSYQEIKASVVHFKLSGNYEQCVSCKNKPFTWGSISGGTLAGITPTTTGATPPTGYNVPANPSDNPREIVWNNGSVINTGTPQNVTLYLYLPAASSIPCCDLSIDICVKISYKDTNCVVCEEVVCGTIVIKKNGGRDDNQLFKGQ